jgi:nucleoside-specific outer membrane channel protein Tsx
MPTAIREAYEKAVANSKETGQGIVSSGKIIFNGQEYDSVDSMPADVRQMYETVMKTVNDGKISITGNVDFKFGKKVPDIGQGASLDSFNTARPIAPRSFFSPRILALAVALLALMIVTYYLVVIGGSR